VVLASAARHLLELGHDCAVLINADSPTLPSRLLIEAIERLRRPGDRVVLGPAIDGGYYLIGLKRAHRRLFEDIPWSTPAVLKSTRERAADVGVEVRELPPWYDVDDAEALAMLVDERAHFGRSASSSVAKNTEAALRISFARRNSKFSLRSFLISSRSSLVGRSGRGPLSASACRTRLRNVSACIPRSLAM
jgi:hypothetical protein